MTTDTCVWHCTVCRCCHANACPTLWGGARSEAPCKHPPA